MKNSLPADRCYRSQAIPGLEIEVLEPSDWTEGRKARVYYRGEELREGEVEEQARKAAERLARQAQHAREAAERLGQLERQARMSAEQQVEQLLARLRQAPRPLAGEGGSVRYARRPRPLLGQNPNPNMKSVNSGE